MSLFVEELIVYLLYLSSNIVNMFLLCNAVLKRRHSITVWVVYTIIKTIIVNIVFRMYCDELIRTNEWMRCIYLTLVSVFAVLTYIMILYTFEEDLSKLAVVSVCAELIAVCLGYISKVVTNLLIGESPFREGAPLHFMDFVSPIISIFLTLVLIRTGKKWIEKIRQWEVRRKKIVIAFFMGYMFFSITSMYFSFERMIVLDGIGSLVFGAILLVRFVNYFHRETLWKNDLLKKRQRLAQMQYETVALQMEKMRQMQKEIAVQMQEIMALSESTENKTEQIEKYIVRLKQHSENVTNGIFCNDWLLDMVLHSAKKKCVEKGIHAEFYLQGYQKSDSHSKKLAEDVNELLESAIKKAKRELFLQIANVKGQIIIKWEIDGKEHSLMWF